MKSLRKRRQFDGLGRPKRETVANFATWDARNVKQSPILRPGAPETCNSRSFGGLGRPKRETVAHFAAWDARNGGKEQGREGKSISLYILPPPDRPHLRQVLVIRRGPWPQGV